MWLKQKTDEKSQKRSEPELADRAV